MTVILACSGCAAAHERPGLGHGAGGDAVRVGHLQAERRHGHLHNTPGELRITKPYRQYATTFPQSPAVERVSTLPTDSLHAMLTTTCCAAE